MAQLVLFIVTYTLGVEHNSSLLTYGSVFQPLFGLNNLGLYAQSEAPSNNLLAELALAQALVVIVTSSCWLLVWRHTAKRIFEVASAVGYASSAIGFLVASPGWEAYLSFLYNSNNNLGPWLFGISLVVFLLTSFGLGPELLLFLAARKPLHSSYFLYAAAARALGTSAIVYLFFIGPQYNCPCYGVFSIILSALVLWPSSLILVVNAFRKSY